MENSDEVLTSPINAPNGLGASSDMTMHDADYLQEVQVVDKNHVQRLEEGKVPPYRAVFLIANAALGAGLLNFPQAFMKSGGIKTALSIELVLLVFIVGAFLILARCANRSQAPTYQDLILFMLGPKFYNISQIMILLYFFGTAITYMIIIGDQLSPVIELLAGKESWYSNKKFLFTMFSLLFLLPLCIPRKLKLLSYTSFFGGFGALFITAVIVYKHFAGDYSNHPEDHTDLDVDWKSSLSAVPVICFGFQCHVSSVAVYAELKNRSTKKFFMCALVAVFVCSLTYSLCGSFGFLTFGAKTKSDILESYHSDDTLANIARVAVVFILLSSFSIVTFCARTVVDGYVLKTFSYLRERKEQNERKRRVIETLTWFALALLLALVVPNIGVAIAIIGGIASSFIFVFPGLCLLKTVNLEKLTLTLKDKALIGVSCLYVVLGAFIFGEVTTLALQQDIEGKNIM